MAAITVRNLDDEVQRRLKRRAAANNQSMEAEARSILSAAVTGGDFARAWVAATAEFRSDDLKLPARTLGRELDLS
ncbi:plasmid stabilization protein [Cryobacterium glaciale]|uniref:Plasmid stabilization protein n=1 Tax=Cryobacterium glaciale TaxID=1259145 RepID=A0A4R8UV33_9MICO|nr:plasmid stabilization protein [Cryobacterium glaciale]TFB72745.1 plasmid stabilization protein [Cryobacterium glaciale]